ncbi:hypothetical protein DFP72DRAFT_1072611 [Ephemerocybe angulata]|uniref:Uncharacterized protein n=1 Tax=Ephemerocybe angulata TaxID=980116 RepID=A0A8H6HP00_9AGAR|nr:hypothetical protein DFP72DRAFT_1072611 [Tulosesus angulatus]
MYTVRRIQAIRYGLDPQTLCHQINDEVELNRHQSLLAPTTTSSSPEPHRPPIPPSATSDQLRHMLTSLASPTDVRSGSLSSISSSPIYIHTSSSASFGRDIDLLLLTA